MKKQKAHSKTLHQTNPFIRDPEQRALLFRIAALESSIFEGATGLYRELAELKAHRQFSKASLKKSVKGS